jgi:hypothetical protein
MDAERLIGDWNERQARRMPLLFAPAIGAALAPGIGSCGLLKTETPGIDTDFWIVHRPKPFWRRFWPMLFAPTIGVRRGRPRAPPLRPGRKLWQSAVNFKLVM